MIDLYFWTTPNGYKVLLFLEETGIPNRIIPLNISNAVSAYFHHATGGLREPDRFRNKEWGEKNKEMAMNAMRQLNDQLAENEFIAGDSFSVADITALCAIDFATAINIPVPESYQQLQRWYAAVSQRQSAAA